MQAAVLYENVRYLVDYQEAHSIRRSAIERILKRAILIERKAVSAVSLLVELVEEDISQGRRQQKALPAVLM